MASNRQILQNRYASDKAEKTMRIYVNRWMAASTNKWMPNTQSDLVMTDYERTINEITDTNIEEIVGGFPAWQIITAAGVGIITPGLSSVFDTGADLSFGMVKYVPFPDDPLKRKAAAIVDSLASKQIVEITDETRNAVNAIIKDGIQKGKSPLQIGRELRPKIGLNSRQMMASANFEEKLLIARPDLSPKQIRDRVGVYERKLHRRRAETIARTEAHRVMSEAQISVFEEAKIHTLIWLALVGHCKECAKFQGQEYPIQATHGLQPHHPDCRCGWLPKEAA